MLDTVTVAPPVGAAAESVTLHVLAFPPTTEAGLQLRETRLGGAPVEGTVIDPPAPVVLSELPAGVTP